MSYRNPNSKQRHLKKKEKKLKYGKTRNNRNNY